jgi:plastocyanin
MTTFTRMRIVLATILVAVSLGSFVIAGTASAEDAVKITVKITDNGFDPSTVEVTQGQSVELTFLWAQVAHPDDEHIIVIDGYKLESEKLDSVHKSTTLKFIATKSGTFSFACDIECDIHAVLQQGVLKVKASGSAGTTLTQSKIAIDPVADVKVTGDTISLAATLIGSDGQPIPKAELTFFVESQFAGTTGLMEVGTAQTGPAGIAQLSYHPSVQAAEKMVVKFEGLGVYDVSETTVNLPGSASFGTAAAASDNTLHGIKSWAHVGFVLIILGVWFAFGFILFQVWKVSRPPSGGGAGS